MYWLGCSGGAVASMVGLSPTWFQLQPVLTAPVYGTLTRLCTLMPCCFFSVLSTGSSSKPSMDQIRAQLAAASKTSKASKAKLPGFPKAGAAAAGAGSQLLPGVSGSGSELYGDEDDYDEDEDEATPAFQITFDEEGRAVSLGSTVLSCCSWKQEYVFVIHWPVANLCPCQPQLLCQWKAAGPCTATARPPAASPAFAQTAASHVL